MFDPNPQSVEFHLEDLERKARPSIGHYRQHKGGKAVLVRVISIAMAAVAAAVLLPMT